MKCPRDGTELSPVRVEALALELDKCHKCDGIWCDRGELEQLRDSKRQDIEEDIEREYGNPVVANGKAEAYMRCPRCGDARLHTYHYTYLKPVAIDRCERCMGIWLDDSELNSIITEKKCFDDADSEKKFGAFLKAIGNLLGV